MAGRVARRGRLTASNCAELRVARMARSLHGRAGMHRIALLTAAVVAAACNVPGTVTGGDEGGGTAAGPDAGTGGDGGGGGGGGGADGGDELDAAALQAALAGTLERLEAELAWRSPGTSAALAVAHLDSGARASVRGDALFVSASSAKAWWVAAALDGVGVAEVQPHAGPVFGASDNGATGAVIDLVGPDAVNEYIWRLGMDRTALTRWNYQAVREATNSPRLMGNDNYTTADDAVRFLEALAAGEALGVEETAALRDWMTLSPRAGFGGWLGSRLPAAAQGEAEHKAGWLPPGCCSNDAYYNTLNEVGIVDTPRGSYAVAILLHGGQDWYGRQVPYAELASCEIYKVVADDPAIDCAREGDPSPP